MGDFGQDIGLFGGSFDPVHNGHCAIAESFLKSEFISELWVLLTPDPPHKPERTFSDYHVRLKMLQAAFRGMSRVSVKDIEKDLPKPSYTLQTLQSLSRKQPDKNFYLCIGEDSLRDFKSWHKWQNILDYCELLVARRPVDIDKETIDEIIAQKTHYVSHQPVDISSTEIRKAVAEGNSISEWVPQAVEKLIKEHNLYK